jgi:hypothetical protein
MTETEQEVKETLFDILKRHGCTPGKSSGGAGRVNAAGADLPLDDVRLHHPEGPGPILTFLASDPNEHDYDQWVTLSHAIKAGFGPTREGHFPAYLDWCFKCPTATEEQSQKTWDSITTSRISWRFIPYPAEVDFDEAPPTKRWTRRLSPTIFPRTHSPGALPIFTPTMCATRPKRGDGWNGTEAVGVLMRNFA